MVFFIGVAVFQIAAMALFAVFHLRPSLTKMYEEHLEKFTESAFWEVTSAKMKIENYTVEYHRRFRHSGIFGIRG